MIVCSLCAFLRETGRDGQTIMLSGGRRKGRRAVSVKETKRGGERGINGSSNWGGEIKKAEESYQRGF